MEYKPEHTLVELIRYHNWANAQLLALCQTLDDSQRTATAPGAYGSIHATFGHLLYAEADYIGRITGQRPQPPFNWQDGPSLPELAAFASVLAEAWLDLVQRTPPAQMVHEEEDGLFIDYTARVLYMQVINHGIEHRTNITTILNSLGVAVPELDTWGYLFAFPKRFAMQQGSLGQ